MKLRQLEDAIKTYKEYTGQPVKSMAIGATLVAELELELGALITCEPETHEGMLFGIPVLVLEEDPYLLALASVEAGTL